MQITVPPQRIRHQRAAPPGRRSLYWAYGSNLNACHMHGRCPAAEAFAPLNLLHTRLVFRGVADVTVERGREVPGGLWEVTPQCERSLDSFEGVGSRVYLKRYFTVRVDGDLRDVLFYQMAASRGVMPPSEQYLRTIADGYGDFGLDLRHLRRALQESWACKDVTRGLEDRYARRGRPKMASRVPRPVPLERPILGGAEFVLSDDDLRQAGAVL